MRFNWIEITMTSLNTLLLTFVNKINLIFIFNFIYKNLRTIGISPYARCMDNAIIETLILLVVFVIFLSYVIYRRCCKDIKYNSRVDTTENISTDTTNQQQQQQQQQHQQQQRHQQQQQ